MRLMDGWLISSLPLTQIDFAMELHRMGKWVYLQLLFQLNPYSLFFFLFPLYGVLEPRQEKVGMLCRDICDRHVHADPHPLAFTHSYCMSFKRFDFLNSEFAWKWFTHTRSACRVHVIYMKEPTRNGMRANSCSSASCKKPKQINSRADRRRAQITGKTN